MINQEKTNNKNANEQEIITLTTDEAETLYLTENDKPFPPEDYKGEGDGRWEI